jgi:hypothetical protein
MMPWYELVSSMSGQDPVGGFYICCIETSGSTTNSIVQSLLRS